MKTDEVQKKNKAKQKKWSVFSNQKQWNVHRKKNRPKSIHTYKIHRIRKYQNSQYFFLDK